jgi:pyruvate/2-oxoglutarate/acetoin dehydrogenase E1 component|tara:strand:- start:2325 stop:3236 length:912 start_codon:yes stop_codon:yes gene_type:complete
MAKALKQTIKEITFKHLKKNKSQVFGQNLTGVGWVAGTLPKLFEKDGVVELPMADVAGGGIVTGSALVGKRPFYIIRYQGYNWFNCTFIINYACKSKEIWKVPCPMFIRGISSEGSIGPVAGSSHLSIFYKMPGIKIFSPMTSKEYKKIYANFMKNSDVFYVSEHRKSYESEMEFKNIIKKNLDIILMPISITRFAAVKAQKLLEKRGYKVGIIHLVNLKPFNLNPKWIDAIKSSKYGALLTDNDYADGILRILAHKVNEKTKKNINVLGLDDRSAGHHEKVDNLPPNEIKIVKEVLNIIKKK